MKIKSKTRTSIFLNKNKYYITSRETRRENSFGAKSIYL